MGSVGALDAALTVALGCPEVGAGAVALVTGSSGVAGWLH